ncbi:alanine/ornithine racemase family PLP-dependent enzyme [Roseivirga sp. E12]|uniref:alanine/ornithine racemase family PLP-dependent enzyme n=1 Tax=Roseivirga sp. E12 TaxID=2819237 RepID=UPI001ABD043C|nr:alanine/ornithine racemase family PLP-dependent enzyme [Roseivirga sp. E12]MBO3697893.1 alanine/ornithine racemase family PLP-dependent enzyme [Roseivirga sp. E12]
MRSPRIEINLKKIAHNARALVNLYGSNGIKISGVTKAICGHSEIAATLLQSGIKTLADSRLENIINMRKNGIKAQFLLLRGPMLSQTEQVVKTADCSLNSEITVLKSLSKFALKLGVVHQVILMVELGDLREGLMPDDLNKTITQLLALKGVKLIGLGTNLACLGGVIPDEIKMSQLSSIARSTEKKFGIKLKIISGGNSANYQWFKHNTTVGLVNNLRLGESIFLGCETIHRKPIPGLFTDAFELVAEIIEVQQKPSRPFGSKGQNASGDTPSFKDRGAMKRAILGIGQQDVNITGLTPISDISIIAASSDHIVIDVHESNLKVGQEVRFQINYNALLSLMTSSYVSKLMI